MAPAASDRFYDWLGRHALGVPGMGPVSASNSLVLTVDEGNGVLPPASWTSASLGLRADAQWLLFYSLLWVLLTIMAYFTPNARPSGWLFWGPVAGGFATGLVISLALAYFGNAVSVPFVVKPVQGESREASRVLLANVPEGEGPDGTIRVLGRGARYKVLIGQRPAKGEGQYAFAYPVGEFLDREAAGDFTAMSMQAYVRAAASGKLPAKAEGNRALTKRPGLASLESRATTLSTASYYVSYVMITWAFYITTSTLGGTSIGAISEAMQWNIMAFALALLAGGTEITTDNETAYRYSIFARQRALVLAVSVSVTAILRAHHS
jgi:hypothetical protein